MPPSQLKRLKASLREQGIVGPQKSKKERKRAGKDGAERAAKRNAALSNIRDSFNPFEVKAAARPEKFESTSLQKANAKKSVLGRPGVTKSMGEETRRKTLLPELNKRNKAGGIIDRRIGENDPNMSLEDKMMERFAREKTRKKGAGLFDLEDDEDQEEVQLTHMGQSLDFSAERDDFDAGSLSGGSDDEDRPRQLKRRRNSEEDTELSEEEEGADEPERKKTKAEVMKEVIAKSKLHKYERQQQKEDDEDLREKLDSDMHDMLSLLRGIKKPPPPPTAEGLDSALGAMNPERAALMTDAEKAKAEKEYDRRLLEMKLDKRAAPTTRTKTEDEKAKEEAEKLKKLEEKRLRRMRGEEDSGDEEEEQHKETAEPQGDDDVIPDDAAEFGFQDAHANLRPLGVDDEDDFVIDDDLVASGSDIDGDEISSGSEAESSDDEDAEPQINEEEEEDEFVRGILGKSDEEKAQEAKKSLETQVSKLAYTYPCPRSHEELLDVLKGVSVKDTPTVVQRIRALYHPQLSAENKEKMADFCGVLVEHISYLALQKPAPPLAPIETLIRHLHSLSRTFPLGVARAFRGHLEGMLKSSTINPGDLIIFTAIGTIYPTSDHFHQVVTPAITIMARWLGLTTPNTPQELVTGAYVGALCLKYQSLSRRYIPELVRFTTLALKNKSTPPDILTAYINNLTAMADLWSHTPAFTEIFTPSTLAALQSVGKPGKKASQHLSILLGNARQRRRPQELHHWRPQPIKTSIPKFEEGFNPDKHYDPDQERREAAKLKAEYRREKKGAMRELRKDASFIAREKLREKKEKDAAYEAKYKRLVAEIQGEEGREKNAYEKERKARKQSRR